MQIDFVHISRSHVNTNSCLGINLHFLIVFSQGNPIGNVLIITSLSLCMPGKVINPMLSVKLKDHKLTILKVILSNFVVGFLKK